MPAKYFESSLRELVRHAFNRAGNNPKEIVQCATEYSEEYGIIEDTGLTLYERAVGYFEGDEDKLIAYLQAVAEEDEETLCRLEEGED